MQRFVESLRRLKALASVSVDTRLARPLNADRELSRFTREAERLRHELGASLAKPPAGIDVDRLWERWLSSGKESLSLFSIRELRALCWDRRAASDTRFLSLLNAEGFVPEKLGFVRGLWHVHQHNWRLPTASILESLFGEAARSTRNQPRWLRNAGVVPELFSESAPEVLARSAFADLSGLPEQLERVALTADGALAQLSFKRCVAQWFELLERSASKDDSKAAIMLSEGLPVLLSKSLVDADGFRQSVERLLRTLKRAGPSYRTVLRDWVVAEERLGHPRRRATSANWAGYSDDAKAEALRLFAAKDIGRFFDILIGRANDYQGRRAFWEKYIESSQFLNYAIACDPVDRRRLISAWAEGTPDVARLNDAPEEHSAFIMHFRTNQYDLVVVEMSRAQNAMYLFNADTFEQRVGSLEQADFSFRALKNRSYSVDWWTHSKNWERRFGEKLWGYGISRGTW